MLAAKIVRFFFIILVWNTILQKPSSSDVFFSGLLIFTGGLAYDYISVHYMGKVDEDLYHKILGIIGFIYSIVFIAFSISGLMKQLELKFTDTGIYIVNVNSMFPVSFSLKTVLILLGFFIFLSGFEIFGEYIKGRENDKSENKAKSVEPAKRIRGVKVGV